MPDRRDQSGNDLSDVPGQVARLRQRINSSPGWQVMEGLGRVRRAWTVFDRNWLSLDDLIGRFKADVSFALDVYASPDGPAWNEFLDDLDVALHNFVASAGTVAELQREVARLHLDGPRLADYQSDVNETFGESARSQFVVGLRNYTLHTNLAATAGAWHFRRTDAVSDSHMFEASHSIILDVPTLLTWEEWNKEGRRYLEGAGKHLDLHTALSGYYEDARSFLARFGKRITEANLDAVTATQYLIEEAMALTERLRGGPVRDHPGGNEPPNSPASQ